MISDEEKKYSNPPLSVVSLSMVSVTWAQTWTKIFKWKFSKIKTNVEKARW